MDLLDKIEELFVTHGRRAYEGQRTEPVSAQAHALQCAQLAEWAQAPPALVAAALLHDVGHFVALGPHDDATDDAHELRALGLLGSGFGADVLEPIRLHVQAKRYLVAVDDQYAVTLSPASLHSLALQGGAMSAIEAQLFEALPYAAQAIALRRWDDLAKMPGRVTPSLQYFLALADSVRSAVPAQARAA